MREPGVTLSDYLLAVVCAGFTWNLCWYGLKNNLFNFFWCLLFSSIAISSIVGGTVHGFFSHESTLAYQILWPTTLLFIGITASSCWMLGGYMLGIDEQIKKWIVLIGLVYLVYVVTVIFYNQNFLVAIINYLPAITFLLMVAILRYMKTKIIYYGWIIIGILISFIATLAQQMQFSFHPIYFNHNTIYHLLEAVALYFIFIGAKGLVNLDRKYL